MAIEITTGTPFAEALQSLIQPKLEALEWSAGGDDLALSEYIVLMLANGKTQDEIASDLFNDFKDLGANEANATEFSRWLFEQVHTLHNQTTGESQQQGGDTMQDAVPSGPQSGETSNADAQMGDAGDSSQPVIPTGPKSMRNGNSKARNGRALDQLNKNMDRSNDSLRRIRGGAGAGRINSHSREPPKGPRNSVTRNNHLNNMFNSPMNSPMGSPFNPMGRGRQMSGMQMGPQFNATNSMDPDQQMQMLQYWEEGARMMQEYLNQNMGSQPGSPAINPAFQQRNQSGKSLFDRIDKPRHNNQSGPRGQYNKQGGFRNGSKDTAMDDADATNGENSSAMDVEAKDPSQAVCKFNLSCAKPDCAFAHQSPAAPPGTSIDLNDECSYGAACKNHKCVARHPSPAKKTAFQKEQDCRFGSNCTNPNCPFKHSTMPLCRNGADCTVANCKFTHSKVLCKFNPCLNPHCTYKHAEDQKRGAFGDKVWTPGEEGNNHVSERKFTDDGVEEELIIPGHSDAEVPTEVAT